MSDLKESTKSTTVVYNGDFLDVRRDEVWLPNGKTGSREWINHPGAVVIIPILPDGKIGLIRQYRYAARSEFIELPAGKLDNNEEPEDCAARELQEESGYKAGKMEFLEIMPTELDKSLDLIWENKITDVKTIIGLLWLQKIRDSL